MLADVRGIRLRRLEVEVAGDVDVRGCLAIERDVPVGFRSLNCEVHVVAAPGTSPEAVATLLKHAEHSCINLATLRTGVPVEFRHHREA
jgi:hypothetical protein